MPLDDNVAVTATIPDPPHADSREQIGIGPVDHVPQKLVAAREAQLDTVYLATDDNKSPEEEKLESERSRLREKRRKSVGQPAARAIVEYEGLETPRVSTMGEVFHGMLVCNKYLREFQLQRRKQWLSQWRPGTGLFESDKEPDQRETGQGS